MNKILYVDLPFSDPSNKGYSRSQFIWNVISKNFDADLLVVKTPDYLTKGYPEHKGFEQIYTLTTAKSGLLKTYSVFHFTKENLDKFTQIIVTKRYEAIVFRGIRFANLAFAAETALENCSILFDTEHLLSDSALLKWSQNPTLKNRKSQLEYYSVKSLERIVFRKNYHFFFAGNYDRTRTLNFCALPQNCENFIFLPDALDEKEIPKLNRELNETEKKLLNDKFLLFFGNLDTEANLDAFLYLTKEIYPRISKKMQDKDIKIYVVGKNSSSIHEQLCGGRIKLLGEVENIYLYIKASLFVILPLRKMSTASQRILEAAQMKKAVLTTTAAASGLTFSPDEIAIEDRTDDYCDRLIKMISNPRETIDMGQLLYNTAQITYSEKKIGQNLLQCLEQVIEGHKKSSIVAKLRIAVLTNHFPPDTDKTGIHVYHAVQKLSETYDVTVFCPRRMSKPKIETMDNVTIYRLFDVLNYPIEFPNIKTKTLCPDVFIKLLKMDFDIIHCYPGLNYNYILAFMAAKIKEIPIVLNVFDIRDYEQIIKEHGKVNWDMLKQVELNWFRKCLLKYTDFIFTVTEKEYTYIRKLNERLEQIPVPIDIREFDTELPSMRHKYGIADDVFIFLCVGKLSYLRGQDIALKAFIKSLPAIPNSKLVFVGKTDFEPDFFEDLELHVSREALQEDVIFTGEIERTEVLSWIKDADISLIPSRFNNVCNVVAESWAGNTPVLQSDAVDPNLVIENYNGFLFRSEDIDDLVQQMQHAYSGKTKFAELAEHGKAIVEAKYTYDYLILRYSKAYKLLTMGA